MRVLLTGTTGMVGQGVLRECLDAPDVSEVISLGRSPLNEDHPKLRSIVVTDLFDLDGVGDGLTGVDACFFCLGVSSVGMSAETYERITHDLTLGVADALAAHSPDPTFVYVSGAGTSETSRQRWAQVKGRTERDLLARFPKGYMFRPGFIQPLHGIRPRSRFYRVLLSAGGFLIPLFRRLAPTQVVTTEEVGKAMLAVARTGAPKHILDNPDIAALARA
ncbi:NAD-dependent epimerase/dehydratase family protein [Asanoa iriomotensis]|uniref:Epimerase n=1 Tax=Asanoa iriomotensis TaxID=234613 RepID=A0ABQ4C4N3_9ACTN|nr:NAD-dependent epimerase/dehydratase family protein [Asanoa iriomotensis]GIF57739.1 epimerase [Asanoa iriomotensis]